MRVEGDGDVEGVGEGQRYLQLRRPSRPHASLLSMSLILREPACGVPNL